MWLIYFFILLIYSENVSIFFLEVYFLLFFFFRFSIRSYVFPNNLVFKICLYGNHFYVFFFRYLHF